LTRAAAIRAGVDHMVIGRPIIRAADPRGAAGAIMDEIVQLP
ncbi:MAG: orotidine-5'-phosphate decarboxylase, partial [Hyphomicrobiales bacterium]|nr:orotidine-5'-phosphate decarboxylase [Hyphomicrobiales bacterium]